MQSHEPNPTSKTNGDSHAAPPHEDLARVPTEYSPRTGLKLGTVVFLLAAALAIAFFVVEHRRSAGEAELNSQTAATADAPATVDVVRAVYAPTTQPLTLPGETRAWYESVIYARVSGYLAHWSADIGDRVVKGQVLATIETPELDDQLNAAKAQMNVAIANVAVTQADSVLAKSNYDRWWQSPQGVVSDQEKEEKKAEYDSSIAKLNAAQSQVNLDQADVDRLTEMAAFKQVRAPFDGVITARRIDIGDLITAGSTANTTSLYSIAQADKIRVYVDVPQTASAAIQVGMDAVAVANEYPGREFHGKVARTSNSINPVSRTMRVETDIPNPDLALLPGMYLQVSFQLKQNAMLQVPASALLFRSAGPQVAVVGDDNKVNFHNITISRDQGDFVEVGSGLNPDDKVALNISSQISDGDEVHAVETDKPATAQAPALSPSQTALADH